MQPAGQDSLDKTSGSEDSQEVSRGRGFRRQTTRWWSCRVFSRFRRQTGCRNSLMVQTTGWWSSKVTSQFRKQSGRLDMQMNRKTDRRCCQSEDSEDGRETCGPVGVQVPDPDTAVITAAHKTTVRHLHVIQTNNRNNCMSSQGNHNLVV